MKCSDCTIKSKATQTLSENELFVLENGCSDVIIKKGDSIFVEGRPPTHVVFLRKGFASIHMTGAANKEQILKLARPGAYLGIQNILGSDINHYSAVALNSVQACFIDISVFKKLIKSNPLFAYEILVYTCKEELNYYHRFVNQYQKQLNGRLAEALLCMSNEIFENVSFTLPFTKSDLAALIGSTRESVTRSLKEFKDSGIINMDGRKILLNDLTRLKRISKTG